MHIGRRAITRNRLQSRRTHRADAFLSSFAENADRFRVNVEIADVQRGQFAQAQTTAVENLHDRSVAQWHPGRRAPLFRHAQRGGEQFAQFAFGSERAAAFFPSSASCTSRTGSTRRSFSLDEKAIEGAQARRIAGEHRNAPALCFISCEKIIAKIVCAAFLPRAVCVFGPKMRQRLSIASDVRGEALRSTSRKRRNSSTRDPFRALLLRHSERSRGISTVYGDVAVGTIRDVSTAARMTEELLGFFDLVAVISAARTAVLAFENRRRIRRRSARSPSGRTPDKCHCSPVRKHCRR